MSFQGSFKKWCSSSGVANDLFCRKTIDFISLSEILQDTVVIHK